MPVQSLTAISERKSTPSENSQQVSSVKLPRIFGNKLNALIAILCGNSVFNYFNLALSTAPPVCCAKGFNVFDNSKFQLQFDQIGKMVHRMPLNEGFWKELDPRDQQHSWDAATRAPETSLASIKGFIVALPLNWTFGEDNVTGMNLSLLANLGPTKGLPVDQETSTGLASNSTTPGGTTV